MNICFIANFNKTYFFAKIAIMLKEQYNINIYWIVFNKKNYEFLTNKFHISNILYLPKNKILSEKYNMAMGEYKINELVINDRILKSNKSMGISYLRQIQAPIYHFTKGNQIEYMFGELTWAHELLIYRLISYSKELKCKYLNPHTIRIPSGRFAFFEDEFQSKLYTLFQKDEEYKEIEKYFIPQKPDYLALNDAILKKNTSLKGRLKRVKKLITSENLDKEDITLPEKWTLNRFLTPIYNELRKETYKFLSKVSFDFVKDKKFVLITLHKQPEASIDVLGRYHENQQQIIENIWKQLPNGWWLVIKEHSNAVGDRPLSFYKKIQKLNNTVFIDEKIDSYRLLEVCMIVVTVSGTVAYEAALLNKKAIVFSDVFFAFSHIKKITLEDFKYSTNFFEILSSIPNKHIDDYEMKKYIYKNSFEGLISDPLSNIKCISEENINKVVLAFKSILK